MSCTNPNCNTGCGCNNCCPPVTPPTPPTPPTCEGTQCEELYDAACVQYTGPAITCFNIPSNSNLNSVIQAIALNICACCTNSQCVNPFKLFFERFNEFWTTTTSNDPTSIFSNVFQTFLNNGVVVKKCQYCCPDSFLYTFAIGPFNQSIVNDVYNSVVGVDNYEIPCENCWTNFNSATTTLLTLFDPTFNGNLDPALTAADIHEWGGFNNVTGIQDLNLIFEDLFTPEQVTDIMAILAFDTIGLSVVCDSQSGNIVIGTTDDVVSYMQNMMNSPITIFLP